MKKGRILKTLLDGVYVKNSQKLLDGVYVKNSQTLLVYVKNSETLLDRWRICCEMY